MTSPSRSRRVQRDPYKCANLNCDVPLDPVLVKEGWRMHPSCELPELRNSVGGDQQ